MFNINLLFKKNIFCNIMFYNTVILILYKLGKYYIINGGIYFSKICNKFKWQINIYNFLIWN